MDSRQLVERYPWLAPKDLDGKIPEDYNYSYTILDEMPIGWRKAFGEEMQKELLYALEKTNSTDAYRVEQAKEKFGGLRWYDSGGNDETDNIIDKYSRLSANICICCGRPDVPHTTDGWIAPICEECFDKSHEYLPERQRREAYLTATKGSPSRMQTKAEFYRYEGKLKILDRTEDYTETARRIRRKWNSR